MDRLMAVSWTVRGKQGCIEIITLVDLINLCKMGVLSESLFVDFALLNDYLKLNHQIEMDGLRMEWD